MELELSSQESRRRRPTRTRLVKEERRARSRSWIARTKRRLRESTERGRKLERRNISPEAVSSLFPHQFSSLSSYDSPARRRREESEVRFRAPSMNASLTRGSFFLPSLFFHAELALVFIAMVSSRFRRQSYQHAGRGRDESSPRRLAALMSGLTVPSSFSTFLP